MPKTPSQKKNSRRKRVSLGRHEENQTRRRFVSIIIALLMHFLYPRVYFSFVVFLPRFSKGRRSNLRGSSVKSLNFIPEEEAVLEASTSGVSTAAKPKRTTRKNKQTTFEESEDASQGPIPEKAEDSKPVEDQGMGEKSAVGKGEDDPDAAQPPPELPAPEVVSSAGQSLPAPELIVSISSSDRLSAENGKSLACSPGRTATKLAIAAQNPRRSSVRCSLKLRHSVAGLRHSMTQESVRRASRRSMLKRKVARTTNSQCSSKNEGEEPFLETSDRC